uniref:Uncharacterized protein n=1 Tax=Sipha flava TaxID=143950 RepID=A0A2S2R815_9HEMI
MFFFFCVQSKRSDRQPCRTHAHGRSWSLCAAAAANISSTTACKCSFLRLSLSSIARSESAVSVADDRLDRFLCMVSSRSRLSLATALSRSVTSASRVRWPLAFRTASRTRPIKSTKSAAASMFRRPTAAAGCGGPGTSAHSRLFSATSPSSSARCRV